MLLTGKCADTPLNVFALISAKDEEEGIARTLDEVRMVLPDSDVLVVDGHSVDRTVEIAKDFCVCVVEQPGLGKGDAVSCGLKMLSEDEDYVVLTDADFTYPFWVVPKMIEILERNQNVGMVCGNRFNGHFCLGRMHDLLYFGNRLVAFAHKVLNGVELRDPLTGLRVVRADILRNWIPRSKGFDIEVELNRQVERRGYAIQEIDILYRARLGQKKLKITHAFTILKRVITEATY